MAKAIAVLVLFLPLLQDKPQEDLARTLERTRVDFELNGDLDDAIARLKKVARLNIYIDPRVQDEIDAEVKHRWKLTNVRLSTVLHWVTFQYGLTWAIQGKVIVFAVENLLQGSVVQRQHDLTGLRRTPKIVWPEPVEMMQAELSAPDEVRDVFAFARPEEEKSVFDIHQDDNRRRVDPGDLIVDIIREYIEPESWDEGDFTIETLPNSQLLVVHHERVQDDIHTLLTHLKKMVPTSVTVEAEIVELSDVIRSRLGLARTAFLDPEATRQLRTQVKPIRRLHLTALEGDQVTATASLPAGADVLAVRTAVTPDRKFVRVRFDLQTGERDLRDQKFGDRNVPLSDQRLVRLATTTILPNGGAGLFLLPGGRVLMLRVASDPAKRDSEFQLFRGRHDAAGGILNQLQSNVTDFHFEKSTLLDVIDHFRTVTGVNFVVSGFIEEAGEEMISFQAKKITAAAALPMILGPRDLRLVPEREAILVTTREDAQRRSLLYLANIRDIAIQPIDEMKGPRKTDWTEQDIAEAIQNNIDPEGWDSGGKSVVADNGILLVRNTEEVVSEIRKLLADFRAKQQVLVTLEVDTVTVPSAKARTLLRPRDGESILTRADADKLVATKGAVVDRLTLRGFQDIPLFAKWSGRRAFVSNVVHGKPEFDRVNIQSTLRARVVPETEGMQVAFELDGRFFGTPRKKTFGQDTLEWPTTATAVLQGSVRIPEGGVAFFELPQENGLSRVLLFRLQVTRMKP